MSGQNRSSAVMQQRHEAHDSLDDFPTPPWATRAFLEWADAFLSLGPLSTVREPAANRGHMVGPLEERFPGQVEASDVHDYGAGYAVRDYLSGPPPPRVVLTVTNPPFRLASDFALRGIATSDYTALFLRTSFLEGATRFNDLFDDHPPSDVLIFSERVVIWKGMLLDPDVPIRRVKGDTAKSQRVCVEKPTTATSYAWFVWVRAQRQTALHFIPPGTRLRLTRPGDYPPLPRELDPALDPALGDARGAASLFDGGVTQ